MGTEWGQANCGFFAGVVEKRIGQRFCNRVVGNRNDRPFEEADKAAQPRYQNSRPACRSPMNAPTGRTSNPSR